MLPHSPHPALPQPSRHSPILSSCSRECLSDLSRSCTSRAAGDRYCSEARRAGGGRPGGAALCCLQEPKEALLSCVCVGGGAGRCGHIMGLMCPPVSILRPSQVPGSSSFLLTALALVQGGEGVKPVWFLAKLCPADTVSTSAATLGQELPFWASSGH